MSQIPIENDDNRSVAASDFVQVDQPDEVPDQEAQQLNLMIANLKALKAELINEIKDQFAKMLSTQSEQHKQQMERLEDKNRLLEEKMMSIVDMQTTTNGALDAKMAQLRDEFSKKLAEQQEQMAQFQAQFHSLEQKLKEAEQRPQTGKNELEEIIQQKMEKFREEMDGIGQQSSSSNLKKLNCMWSQLMVKGKILANPKGIVWDRSKSKAASISQCGLKLKSTSTNFGWVFATKGYAISGEHCRKENFQFPGTIVSYYETTITSNIFGYYSVGFTDGSNPVAGRYVGGSPNSYGISEKRGCWLSGKEHKLECPCGAIAGGRVAGKKHNFDRPIGSFDAGDVFGSGLLLNSKNELAVFFTVNGILLGRKFRINPTVDRLYPTMSIFHAASVEANFGDNLVTHPFQYDVDKCPGLVFE